MNNELYTLDTQIVKFANGSTLKLHTAGHRVAIVGYYHLIADDTEYLRGFVTLEVCEYQPSPSVCLERPQRRSRGGGQFDRQGRRRRWKH